MRKISCGLILIMAAAFFLIQTPAWAMPVFPELRLEIGGAEQPEEVVGALQILFLLTVLTLVPSILVLMTSFTRIIIVLSFIRSALATHQTPPNQVLIGLALFLTFFTMAPVYQEVKVEALDPYLAGQVDFQTALALAEKPVKEFMFRHTREKDLALFVN